MSEDRKRLQAELTGLKSHLGGHVVLKKTKDGPHSPFPILITISIDKPKTYENYDVDRLCIQIMLDEDPGGFHCGVQITNDNLPKVLRDMIQCRLEDFLRSYKHDGNPIGLLALCGFVEEKFGLLLSLRREFIEPYEVADPGTGRSVRRIAILNNDSRIEIDASIPSTTRGKVADEGILPKSLEQDAVYLSRTFGKDFRCIPAKRAYVKAQISDKCIIDFFHTTLDAGKDIMYPALQHASFHMTVTLLPSSQGWSDIVPTRDGDPRLVLQVYIADSFPSKDSVVCRIQFADECLFPEEYSPIVLAFEKILLYKAFVGDDRIQIKDFVKYCMNHADEAMTEAVQIWEEAQEKKKKEDPGTEMAGSNPGLSIRYVTSLHGLQMDGIDAMTLHNSSIEVQCDRCRTRAVMQHGNLVQRWNLVESVCSACNHPITVSVQVRIIHCSSNVLCILACVDCTPMDILPGTSLEVQCHCSDTSLVKDQFHHGRWNEKRCRICHRKGAYRFDRIIFEQVKNQSDTTLKRLKGIARAETPQKAQSIYDHDAALVRGQPLPDTGTCIHYHHSHRWLRFPCCGRRYPCDLCHEEMTDGHEMKWANTMVCGFCSLEQRVDSRCSGCSKKLTTTSSRPEGKNTRFWEGGTGQRNKKRLSKKDPHKFRNSKAKTVSKKAAAKNTK